MATIPLPVPSAAVLAITTIVFPTFVYSDGTTILPDVDYKEYFEDGTIRSTTESGLVITRLRFTRQRHNFEVKYAIFPDDQKLLFDSFLADPTNPNCVYLGTLPFQWTHPTTSVVYAVRFSQVPQWTYAGMNGAVAAWDVTFKLQEY